MLDTSTRIVQKGHKALAEVATPVPFSEIPSKRIRVILERMSAALHTQADGVAIAAPQIGETLRIFIVNGAIFDEKFTRGKGLHEGEIQKTPDQIYINPEIIKVSKSTKWMHEGCLSVRPWWGEVKRHTHVTIRAFDENGNLFERGAGGLLAHIFQHETDHLNGVLFDSKARNLSTESPSLETNN